MSGIVGSEAPAKKMRLGNYLVKYQLVQVQAECRDYKE